ncbi:hypothetical protein ACQKOA_26425 [Bacillus mobilis]|uniref:hypothetical protein n=1 Tax=Bacillus mobilis TaxID=2026190 RepID=UPI003CFE2D2F
MMDVNEFLDLTDNKTPQVSVKFGKIPANYASGRPTVILDGMTAATVKKYPYLSTYTPVANHRVMIVQGVIIGDIK